MFIGWTKKPRTKDGEVESPMVCPKVGLEPGIAKDIRNGIIFF